MELIFGNWGLILSYPLVKYDVVLCGKDTEGSLLSCFPPSIILKSLKKLKTRVKEC